MPCCRGRSWPAWIAPWLEGLRDRVARQHVESLLVLGECRGRQGRTGPARTIVREALDLEPLREDVWRLAMRIEVGGGNVARALARYEQLRELLADELGQILRGRPRICMQVFSCRRRILMRLSRACQRSKSECALVGTVGRVAAERSLPIPMWVCEASLQTKVTGSSDAKPPSRRW